MAHRLVARRSGVNGARRGPRPGRPDRAPARAREGRREPPNADLLPDPAALRRFGHRFAGSSADSARGAFSGPLEAGSAAGPVTRGPVPARSGAGRPLPERARRRMEDLFGTDLSDVRVHEGPEAGVMRAQAYTRGPDLYFAPGRFSPRSFEGRKLLAHELAHVIQQRHGRVPAVHGEAAPVNDDPALEAEARAAGERAAQAGIGASRTAAGARRGGAPAPAAGSAGFPAAGAAAPAPAAGQPVQRNGGDGNKKEDETTGKVVAGAEVATGAKLVHASSDAATGRQTVYHGTSGSNAAGIRQEGLQPSRGGSGGAGEAVGNKEFVRTSRNLVHVSTNPATAKSYADITGGSKGGPEVVKAKLPYLDFAKMREDPYMPGPRAAAFRGPHPILPKFILGGAGGGPFVRGFEALKGLPRNVMANPARFARGSLGSMVGAALLSHGLSSLTQRRERQSPWGRLGQWAPGSHPLDRRDDDQPPPPTV